MVRRPPIRRLDVALDTRAGHGIKRLRVLARRGSVTAVNGRNAADSSRGAGRLVGKAAMMLLSSIDADLRICAEHRYEPVRIDITEGPGHLLPDSERLAAALHLPAVDPDRQPHALSLPTRQLLVEQFPLVPRSGRGADCSRRAYLTCMPGPRRVEPSSCR